MNALCFLEEFPYFSLKHENQGLHNRTHLVQKYPSFPYMFIKYLGAIVGCLLLVPLVEDSASS